MPKTIQAELMDFITEESYPKDTQETRNLKRPVCNRKLEMLKKMYCKLY